MPNNFCALSVISEFENADPRVFLLQAKATAIDYLPRIVGVLFFLVFAYAAIKALNSLVKQLLSRSKIDVTLHNFILALVRNSLRVLAGIVALLILKVPASPLITVIGSVGLALSLALKDSLANIAGGFSILVNRPFLKGDLIEIKDTIGIVSEIDLFYTRITTDDDKTVYLPNGDTAKSVVINYSSEPLKRLDFDFFIPLNSDFSKAKEIVLTLLTDNAYTLPKPKPIITINGRASDSYSVSCRVWTKSAHYDEISAQLGVAIDQKLKDAGIE